MTSKPNIKDLDRDTLSELCSNLRAPMFRVKQIEQWLFQKGASTFDEMSNLPKSLRSELDRRFEISTLKVLDKQISSDGTRKYLFSLSDGTSIETVGIPSNDNRRLTVCFSTQAGCSMGCTFCATGLNGFTRNLSASEMYDQVFFVGQDYEIRVSNVVAMGQGEPFANYGNVLEALHLMNDKAFLGIGARHITVSTCGIIPGVERFSSEPEQFTLAISLHASIQSTRDKLMPGVRNYPLTDLRRALDRYIDSTGRRPTFEYAPIDGINDDDEHLSALINFCAGTLCHVNLIPLNPVEDRAGMPGSMAPSPRIHLFHQILNEQGIETSIRSSRGSDIDGACGQLRQKHFKKEL